MQKSPSHQGAIQAYLNLCAAIGERVHKIRTLEAELEEAFKKASEAEKKIIEEEKAALEAFRAQAEKEADQVKKT